MQQHEGRRDWTALIGTISEGNWVHPETGKRFPPAPFRKIEIAESLLGQEADLVSSVGLNGPFAVVGDEATWEAMGRRVSKALSKLGTVRDIVLDNPKPDLKTSRALQGQLSGIAGVVAVGSGSINDVCKHATAELGLDYCVFGTAASMNGYTSPTASMTLDSGLKVSLKAHAPLGVFLDLDVARAAPLKLTAAGFGDTICRSVCQIDWWMSHRLLDTPYFVEPFLIELPDEAELNARAHRLPEKDLEAVGYLQRVLTLGGLGMNLTGVSNHGSMGEHQISHYIDCFAGAAHRGSLHGEQVGVASLTMARIQQRMLASQTPPKVKPTRLDIDDMRRRMGSEIADQCVAEYRKKALDQAGADRMNARLEEIWSDLRAECAPMALPVEEMKRLLEDAKAATSASDLGLDAGIYREAVRHGHEMRNRFSFADLAADAQVLDAWIEEGI